MFNDIFKKTSKKEKKEPLSSKIIIDIHEKNSLIPSCLIERQMQIEFRSLEIGDYVIQNIVIERKTFSDLISSMISKRLFQQLNQLQQYEKKMLILEGRHELKEDFFLNPNSYKGLILSILLNHQVPIIYTENEEQTADYLMLLAKQQVKQNQEMSFHSRIPKTEQEQKKYILESFPGIGPKTAEKLLNEFKNLKNIFNASEEQLKPILKSKTLDFKKILNKNYLEK